MYCFTPRNAVIVALVQTALVVAGVLAAGAAHKWHVSLGFSGTPPATTVAVCEYGFLALAVPLAWAAVALYALQHSDDDDGPRVLALLSGMVVILLLLVGVYWTAARPLLHLAGSGCFG